jgi:1-acyl-sn-glycerol-3-phosphate acyltransferase
MEDEEVEGAPEHDRDPPEREDKTAEIPPLRIALYGRESERQLARHFNAIRLSKSQRPDPALARGRPLIIYLNHPSWWDPLICLQLARELFPDRRHYGPIDAGTAGQYRSFKHMGFFEVDPGSARGARRFLALAQDLLGQPDAALWIPDQGRFGDPRERPVRLRSGIGSLAARVRQAVLLPLALEMPFWEAQLPEVLARFGEELPAGDADLRAGDWTEVLEDRLESALDALAAESLARDPARFDVLHAGGAEATGLGAAWRRFLGSFRSGRSQPP